MVLEPCPAGARMWKQGLGCCPVKCRVWIQILSLHADLGSLGAPARHGEALAEMRGGAPMGTRTSPSPPFPESSHLQSAEGSPSQWGPLWDRKGGGPGECVVRGEGREGAVAAATAGAAAPGPAAFSPWPLPSHLGTPATPRLLCSFSRSGHFSQITGQGVTWQGVICCCPGRSPPCVPAPPRHIWES